MTATSTSTTHRQCPNDARGKSFSKITHDMDSIKETYDSIGRAYYNDDKRMAYALPMVSKTDSLRAMKLCRDRQV